MDVGLAGASGVKVLGHGFNNYELIIMNYEGSDRFSYFNPESLRSLYFLHPALTTSSVVVRSSMGSKTKPSPRSDPEVIK